MLPWCEQAAACGNQTPAACILLRDGLVSVQCQAGLQPLHIKVMSVAEFIYASHTDLQ
jgi:hypothetical protein